MKPAATARVAGLLFFLVLLLALPSLRVSMAGSGNCQRRFLVLVR
jgi:hypothetical protein